MKKLACDILANNESWLREEYLVKKKSVRIIAKECCVSDDTIFTRLRRFNIKIRGRGEANNLGYSLGIKKVETPALLKLYKSRKTGNYKICLFCKNSFYERKKGKRIFCSRRCRSLYRTVNKNPDADWRDYPEYSSWRRLVYFRDNWKCRICDSKVKINAHHIFNGKEFPTLRFEISNGITLCEKHHIMLHKYISPFMQECIKKTSNIGGTPEEGNPEALIRGYLLSLIRSNDYQEES